MSIRRGEIWFFSLDPVVGKEIAKTRPAVVVSNDRNNEHAGTVTVVPLTSKNVQTVYPYEVFLARGTGNLPKDSKAKANQVRTLDKGRAVSPIGNLGKGDMTRIDAALRIHLDLA